MLRNEIMGLYGSHKNGSTHERVHRKCRIYQKATIPPAITRLLQRDKGLINGHLMGISQKKCPNFLDLFFPTTEGSTKMEPRLGTVVMYVQHSRACICKVSCLALSAKSSQNLKAQQAQVAPTTSNYVTARLVSVMYQSLERD